jgi:hypothetical protein
VRKSKILAIDTMFRTGWLNKSAILSDEAFRSGADETQAAYRRNGDNLESQIMMPIEKRLLLSRAAVFGLVLATSATFGAGAVLASAMSLQAISEPSTTAARFTGTWHWMFKGKSVVTMVLAPSEAGFIGSITAIQGIDLDNDGSILKIEPGEGTIPISKTSLDGSVLHFTTKDEDDTAEWTVTLKDDGNAEVRGVAAGAPAMKPIAAEKIR